MGKKATKASRKYAASGQLKKEIQARKKHQQIMRTIERRKGGKAKGKGNKDEKENAQVGRSNKGNGKSNDVEDEESDEDEEMSDDETGKFKGTNVDDFLKGGFMGGDSDDEEEDEDGDEDGGDEDEENDDVASFASIDDLEDEAVAHKIELKKLAEQDPEFYKYLQENDEELLDFDVDEDDDEDLDIGEDGMDEDDREGETKAPVLTKEILRKWQKALLDHRSLKALRRLILAFRAAAHMNEDVDDLAWTIDSPSVYEKLVSTTLRYTPVLLDHHVPYKALSDGRFKPPTQTPKLKTLQKLILSYFYNILHLIEGPSDENTLLLAVNESSKIVPYIISSRKAVRTYIKTCLKLWSSATDDVRIAAFLAIRKLTAAIDKGIKDLVLKSTYLSLLRNAKNTTSHTLPSINLMKNSASELFCEDHAASYQYAFGYIRQLAIHLRNSMKVKSKDAFKQVYNWQYVHCIDFWCIVLARACDSHAELQRGEESELKALIYPLTQVALGAIKLISSSRSYPFHLHLIRSLVHLARHSGIYIPLTPYLLPIISSTLSPSSRPKAASLRPLDLETNIRAPTQYQRTRVYYDTVLEEAVYLLAEWLATSQAQGSVAFPELVVGLTVTLKKNVKRATGGKEAVIVKGILERVDEGSRWIAERRKAVSFGPKNLDQLRAWERAIDLDETPMGKYVKTQRKLREKRRKLVEKAREGEDEYLEQ